MIQNLKARIVITVAVLALATIWILPNFVDVGEDWWFSKDKLVYGLDIQGGLHLVMGVDVEGVISEKTQRIGRSFRSELEQTRNVPLESVTSPENRPTEMIVTVKNPVDTEKVTQYIEEFYPTTLQVLEVEGPQVHIQFYDSKIQEYKQQVVAQSIEVIRNRIDEFGVAEPNIAAQGDDRILVQLPGVQDATRAKNLINRTARLQFRLVSDQLSSAELQAMIDEAEKAGGYTLGDQGLSYAQYIKRLNEDLKGKLPENTEVVFQKPESAKDLETAKIPLLIRTDTDVGGEELEDASVSFGEYGEPEVAFSFNPEGRRKFGALTGENIGAQLAIVLDNVVQSAPTIQSKITDRGRITLNQRDYQSGVEEAKMIAMVLRAGALPAALEQLEERTVGPSLGAESIRRGQIAGIVGLSLVLVFMLFYYRKLGIVADIALTLNIILILAILTSLGATLTLPGVAGIVLTIGMAVDANVIIFERIKEELRKGTGLQTAIKDGFGHAFSAIFDANITTAAICVVLMYYGTGPVRGFAVTLLCGIITSMFTAIFVSRTVLEIMVTRFHVKKLITVK